MVYTNALYSSTGYGGMKKYPTGSTSASAVITVWNGFGDGSMHYGSVAVTSDASIYISSHYMFGYSSLYNNYDKVLYYAPGQTYTATTVLGPKPASFSYVSTPAINTADSICMSMSFKVSYMVYFRYEGAYMESSVDGGSTWKYVPASAFTTGGYYGTSTCSPNAGGTEAINEVLFDVDSTAGDENVINVEQYEFCVEDEVEDGVKVGFLIKACLIKDGTCSGEVLTLDAKGANNF